MMQILPDSPEINMIRLRVRAFGLATLRVIAADTRQVRGLLALTSFGMGAELLLPWNTLNRHGYEILAEVFTDGPLGALYWLHCILMLRTNGLLTDLDRPTVDKWGYRLGFMLFSSLFLSVDIELGAMTLQGMAVASLAVAAFLLMIRRGNGAKGGL